MAETKEKVEVVKHDSIFGALSALQAELKAIPKTGKVSFKKKGSEEKVEYTYTPLDEIMAVLYPLLGKHGLSVRHELSKEGVECILTHATAKSDMQKVKEEYADEGRIREVAYAPTFEGELRSGVLPISKSGDMKDTGGQITYARRYTLTMLLGIASEEDKDAQFEEARTENLEKFAFAKAKENIQKATTVEQIAQQATFVEKDLKAIADGKAPSLGLAKEQYEELQSLLVKRKVEIEKGLPPKVVKDADAQEHPGEKETKDK